MDGQADRAGEGGSHLLQLPLLFPQLDLHPGDHLLQTGPLLRHGPLLLAQPLLHDWGRTQGLAHYAES